MHETFMPPPKRDALESPPTEPPPPPPRGRSWLTAAIWTALVCAALCFGLLVLVDRAYGWPAYAAVAIASLATAARGRMRCSDGR